MMTFTLVVAATLAASAGPERADDPCTAPPNVVKAVSPTFPDLPWRARIGGTQAVEVTVDDTGAVSATVIASEPKPHLSFDVAAVAAAEQWRFDARLGCPARKAILTFRFAEPVPPERPTGTAFLPPFEVEVVVPARTIEVRSNHAATAAPSEEIVTIVGPGARFLTIQADRSVRYGPTGEQGACEALTPAEFSTVDEALQVNADLLENLAAVDYTEHIHDVATIAILFPQGSRPTHLWEIEIPVGLIPERLLPLLRTFDRFGRRACGARYERVIPEAR